MLPGPWRAAVESTVVNSQVPGSLAPTFHTRALRVVPEPVVIARTLSRKVRTPKARA